MKIQNNHLSGTKVIVRSNDYDLPFWVGTYFGTDTECHNVSVVINENNQPYWIGGIVVPYSDALVNMLKGLSNKEQWDILISIKRFWSDYENHSR